MYAYLYLYGCILRYVYTYVHIYTIMSEIVCMHMCIKSVSSPSVQTFKTLFLGLGNTRKRTLMQYMIVSGSYIFLQTQHEHTLNLGRHTTTLTKLNRYMYMYMYIYIIVYWLPTTLHLYGIFLLIVCVCCWAYVWTVNRLYSICICIESS